MVNIMSGKIIPNARPIKKCDYQLAIQQLKTILPHELSIFPFGSAGKKEISMDIDILIDTTELLAIFPSYPPDIRVSRQLLSDYLTANGLISRRSGVSVHVGLSLNGEFIQVDLMTVEYPLDIQLLHDHEYDTPDITGKLIVSIWADLAKLTSPDLMISPYRGLMNRITKELITRNKDHIAKVIIDAAAVADDLRSPAKMLLALINQPFKLQSIKHTYNI